MKHIATRLQANWDWRAAGNFVFGAAGGCLLAIAAAASFPAPPPMAVTLVSLALIWVAHIGFDRMLGYGLKYPTAFGHTHLGVVGKLRRA